jgi:hypothetical protein
MNWANDNPEAYYYYVMNQKGLGGLDARSQMGQSMFRDAQRGYGAAKMNNMALWWPEYLEQWDVNAALDQMSQSQMGIDVSNYGGGRDRWGMRGGQ